MKLLQLSQISYSSVKSLASSFDNLPETSHKDGKFRLRRYSVVELRTTFWDAKTELKLFREAPRDFLQSEELNKHQGGMTRKFEPIEDEAIFSDGMQEGLLMFKEYNNLADGQEVEIHQMRVITLGDKKTPVSPEGVHQDGFDCIAMLGVNRHKAIGGELLVYAPRHEVDQGGLLETHEITPFMTYQLNNGDMAMLDDSKLWHNATPIEPTDSTEVGYIDLFVFCANNETIKLERQAASC